MTENVRREALIFSAIAIILGGGATLLAFTLPLPKFIYPKNFISRPVDFISALFFLVAFLLIIKRFFLYKDMFTGMLLACILLNIGGQVYMSFSKQLFDVFFDTAHWANILSYCMPVMGVTVETLRQMKKSHQEIFERKRAEEALGESEKRYRTLVENVPVAVYRTTPGPEGKFLMANPASLKMFGLDSEEELKEMTVADFYMKPKERKRFSDKYAAEGGVTEAEVLLKKKDGTPVWGLVSVKTEYDESGKDFYFDCIIMDITARKQAEEALREEKNLLRTVIDNVPDYVYVKDTENRYLLSNTAFARLFGATSPEEVVDKTAFELFPHEEASKYYADDQQIIRTGKPLINREDRPVNKEGETIWNLTSKIPLRDSSGKIIGLVGIARDITERKKAEEEKKKFEARLQRIQRMETIGTLAGGVAHDLNNILAGLVSYPELILLDLPIDSPLRKSILTIQKSGEKAAAIVQDLLTLARRGVPVTAVVNLNHIISEQLKSPEFERLKSFHQDVQVDTNFKKDLLNIKGSTAHLSKTVMNLISNAAEAMPGGGTIFISTENRYIDRPIRGYDHVQEGDYVILSVSDTGIGIASEDMEKIFEPFYTKKVMGRSGTGLGMAVVWGTVKDHKGYIDLESYEGKGTTFTLYFPVTREELTKDKSRVSIEDYMGRGESILVVDDVEEQREIASRFLKRLSYAVTTVSSGEEAVKYLKKHIVKLIVLDMIMDPGIDGLDTYKQIIELHPRQKAIIASGFSETNRIKEAQRLGAGQYIKKPFNLENIGLAVKEELEK